MIKKLPVMQKTGVPSFGQEDPLEEGMATHSSILGAYLVAQMVKNLPAMGGPRFSPWVGKNPWRRAWQPTLVFLPGEFHGQRTLAGYSPGGRKESDMTK